MLLRGAPHLRCRVFAGGCFSRAARADATSDGAHALQLFVVLVLAAFSLVRLAAGQTLANEGWRIRLVEVTPRKATCASRSRFPRPHGSRFLGALRRDRQFLHDRLAGTRLERITLMGTDPIFLICRSRRQEGVVQAYAEVARMVARRCAVHISAAGINRNTALRRTH